MSKHCELCNCCETQACREGCTWFRGGNVCDACVLSVLHDVADSFNQAIPERIAAITNVKRILKNL